MLDARPALLAVFALSASASADDEILRRAANGGQVLLEDVPVASPELTARVDSYLDVRGAALCGWGPDGALWIRTRSGEGTRVDRVEQALGPRSELGVFDEPLRQLRRRPGHAEFSFVVDAGGDGVEQLSLFDASDGTRSLLGEGDARDGAAVWSHDGELLAFQSTRRDGVSRDVWILDPERPESARLVLAADDGGWSSPADFDREGQRLLVSQWLSISDSRVHLVDLGTGASRLVAGGGMAPGSYLGVRPTFTRDGSGVYLATDERGEFRHLARQDLDSGERVLLSDAIPWDVDAFELSPDGAQAAFTVNADGLSLLYLLETSTNRYQPVRGLPIGVISDLTYAPDGEALALTIESPTLPGEVYVVRTRDEPSVERWTRAELGALDAAEFAAAQIVHYPTFDQLDGSSRHVPALLYLPEGEGPFGVVVAIRGHPGSQARPRFDATYQYWVTELGLAVVLPNVRGSTGYGKSYAELDNGRRREDAVRDVGALLAWIERHPELDAQRVAIYGESYGGYLALAAAVREGDRLAAVIDVGGISNFVSLLENTPETLRDLRRPEYGDEREPEMRAQLEEFSPDRHAARIIAPLFVAFGRHDLRVPARESERIVEAVRGEGREVWSLQALDDRHDFTRTPNRALFARSVVMFLHEHLLSGPEDG